MRNALFSPFSTAGGGVADASRRASAGGRRLPVDEAGVHHVNVGLGLAVNGSEQQSRCTAAYEFEIHVDRGQGRPCLARKLFPVGVADDGDIVWHYPIRFTQYVQDTAGNFIAFADDGMQTALRFSRRDGA